MESFYLKYMENAIRYDIKMGLQDIKSDMKRDVLAPPKKRRLKLFSLILADRE